MPRADLNGLVRFAQRRNLVSASVPSHFKRSLPSSVRKSSNLSTLEGQTTHGIWGMSIDHYRAHKSLPNIQSQQIPEQKPNLPLILCAPCSLVTSTDFVWTTIQFTYCTQQVTSHCHAGCGTVDAICRESQLNWSILGIAADCRLVSARDGKMWSCRWCTVFQNFFSRCLEKQCENRKYWKIVHQYENLNNNASVRNLEK